MAERAMDETAKADDEQDELGNAAKAEWVALMCCIAERDRDLYRELRAEAWESVEREGIRSTDSN